MEKKIYRMPEMKVMDYALGNVIAMSWSDERTDEALTNERNSDTSGGWDSFWEERE